MMRSHKNAICRFVKDTVKTFTPDFADVKVFLPKNLVKSIRPSIPGKPIIMSNVISVFRSKDIFQVKRPKVDRRRTIYKNPIKNHNVRIAQKN